MAVRVQCPSCGARIKAPEAALGKKSKCPGCKQMVLLQALDSGGSRASTNDSVQWMAYTAAGQQLGPVSKQQLDQWVSQGTVDAQSHVFCTGWTDWRPAAEIYPALAGAVAPVGGGADPFAFQDQQAPMAPIPVDTGVAVMPQRVRVKRQPGSVRDRAGNVASGWFVARAGLTIAPCTLGMFTLGLIVTCVAFGIGSDPTKIKTVSAMLAFCGPLLTFGLYGTLVAWWVCGFAPRKSGLAKMFILGTLGCVVIAQIVDLIGAWIAVGSTTGGIRGPLAVLAQFLAWPGLTYLVLTAAAFVLFGFFCGEVGGFLFGSSLLLSIIYAGYVGVATIWAIVYLKVFVPTVEGPSLALTILTLVLLTGVFAWAGVFALLARMQVARAVRRGT